MNEHPILFNNIMVRAILDGRKTKTRRAIRLDWWRCLDPEDHEDRTKVLMQCPYGHVGDRLWGRETLRRCEDSEGSIPLVLYDAGRDPVYQYARPAEWHWANSVLPARYMPRWASRIMLEIVDVRVEQVQDISERDAIAEGMMVMPGHMHGPLIPNAVMVPYTHRDAFEAIWDSINSQRGYSWNSNPWVWVIEFLRIVS